MYKQDIIKKVIFVLLLGFVLFSLVVFFKIFFENANFSSQASIFYNSGALAGLIGFLALSLLIISGELARFFDKFFGMDKIIKTQRKFSVFTALFIVSHPVLFILSNSFMAKFLLPDFAILSLAMGTIALYLFIIILMASFLYKKISQTMWQYLHIVIYALFFIAMFHAINHGSSFATNNNVKIIFFILLALFFLGVIYRTQYKIRQIFKQKSIVLKVRKETHDTFTLVVTKPKNFEYEAGQFSFLKLNKNKLYARHPFTIASAPHQEELEFTIKDAGKFTATAKKLKKGEKIRIEGPYGTFIPGKDADLIFVAGGVGITPFMSIIKNRTHNDSKQKMTLFYASKTERDIIFKEELDQLQKKNKNLRIIYCLSRENKKGYEQRLNKENFLRHLKTKNKKEELLMMCGPEELKKSIKNMLREENIKIKIKTESFFW